MGESFKKIKNKYLLVAILKTIIIALASGLGGVGIAFLVVTLGNFAFHWAYYIAIGLGLFFVVGIPIFIKEYPTEKALAKELDEKYELKERVQTMMEYRNDMGELSVLQRNDTNERLKVIEKKRPYFREFVIALIVAVICISIFASGLAVSFTTKADTSNPSEYIEPNFDYSVPRQNAMLELIDNVRNSELNDVTKENLCNRLTELHNYALNNTLKVSEVKGAVVIAVAYIDIELEGLTTYRDVHSKVTKIDTGLADGIVASLNAYKQYASQFTSFTNVKKIYEGIVKEDELITSAMDHFERTEALLLQTNVENATVDHIRNRLGTFVKDANSYLAVTTEAESDGESDVDNNGEINTDALLNSFVTLNANFELYKDKINEYIDLVAVRAELQKYFTAFYQSFRDAMLEEVYDCIMQRFIRNKICSVFSVQKTDLPQITPDPILSNSTDDPSGSDSGNEGEGGGGGTGDTLYASDDVIYDPDQAKYVKYGDILAEHEAKMHDTLMSSELPEEIKKAILAYFQYISIFNEKE